MSRDCYRQNLNLKYHRAVKSDGFYWTCKYFFRSNIFRLHVLTTQANFAVKYTVTESLVAESLVTESLVTESLVTESLVTESLVTESLVTISSDWIPSEWIPSDWIPNDYNLSDWIPVTESLVT